MLLFLLVLGILPSSYSSTVDRLEASVNSSLILRSDIQKFRKLIQLRMQLDPLFPGTPIANKGPNSTDGEVVRFLVDEKIMAQAFPVTDSEVEQEIQSIQTSNRISRKDLRQALTDQGFAYEDYFELIRMSVVKRNLIDREIRPKVVITDDEIRAKWIAGGGVSKPGKNPHYTFRLVHVNTKDYKSEGAAKNLAEQTRKRIMAGESIDEASQSVGGAMDFNEVVGTEIQPLIRNAIQKLKPGETSPVIGSGKSGFYLIHLTARQEGKDESFEKSKEEIRNRMMADEFRSQIQIWLAQKREGAFLHYANPESAQK